MKYLLGLLALPVVAQYLGLTTNLDGSEFYFATYYRQRDTTQPLHGKIFRLNDREMKPALIVPVEKRDEQWSNYYDINAPYFDENGQLAGFNASRACYIPTFYACSQSEGSSYRGVQYSGSLRFSLNHRYAASVAWLDLYYYSYKIFDLGTRNQIASANGELPTTLTIDNTGALYLVHQRRSIQRLAPGDTAFQVVLESLRLTFTGIESPGAPLHLLAWTTTDSGEGSQLIEIDLASKAQTPIGDFVPLRCSSIRKATGTMLIAECESKSKAQILRLDSPNVNWRNVSDESQSVNLWTVSGDGKVIWYVSGSNAFHKVALLEETDETRLPATGWISPSQRVGSPGSLAFFKGEGLKDYRLSLKTNGAAPRELIPLARNDSQLVYQIPWDLMQPLNAHKFEARNQGPSHFDIEEFVDLRLESLAPLFFDSPDGSQLASPGYSEGNRLVAHQDFSRLVTASDPALPNEIVHLWAVNLGPVASQLQTGQPAPLDKPSPITSSGFRCRSGITQQFLQLLYAGLAPGMTGIYQVSLRLPASSSFDEYLKMQIFDISCGFFDNQGPSMKIPAKP